MNRLIAASVSLPSKFSLGAAHERQPEFPSHRSRSPQFDGPAAKTQCYLTASCSCGTMLRRSLAGSRNTDAAMPDLSRTAMALAAERRAGGSQVRGWAIRSYWVSSTAQEELNSMEDTNQAEVKQLLDS